MTWQPTQQMIIPFALDKEAVFTNFFSPKNGPLIRQLQQLQTGTTSAKCLFIWGDAGCGKTHLLHACCHLAEKKDRTFSYIHGKNSTNPFSCSDHITTTSLVCIDEVENIAGNPERQQALFNLYERVTKDAGKIVLAASAPPATLDIELKDLVSRMSAGGVYRIEPLTETDKFQAFKLRAKRRGIRLDNTVIQYILNHYQRDTHSLFSLLDQIDNQSLAEQHKVTIPFIKQLLVG